MERLNETEVSKADLERKVKDLHVMMEELRLRIR